MLRESHGSRKLENNSVEARGEGGVAIGSGVAGVGGKGKSPSAGSPWLFFPLQSLTLRRLPRRKCSE